MSFFSLFLTLTGAERWQLSACLPAPLWVASPSPQARLELAGSGGAPVAMLGSSTGGGCLHSPLAHLYVEMTWHALLEMERRGPHPDFRVQLPQRRLHAFDWLPTLVLRSGSSWRLSVCCCCCVLFSSGQSETANARLTLRIAFGSDRRGRWLLWALLSTWRTNTWKRCCTKKPLEISKRKTSSWIFLTICCRDGQKQSLKFTPQTN